MMNTLKDKIRTMTKSEKKIYAKAYYQAHAEEIKVRVKAYAKKNPHVTKAATKKYSKVHREKINAACAKYRRENPEKRRASLLKYSHANPDKLAIQSRKRRALENNVCRGEYENCYIFERDNWTCQICGRKINKRLKWPNPLSKSIDHIVPLSKGGDDSPMNVQATHLRCNLGKNATNKGQLRLFG